ncbi:MAG: hypothetical protein IPK66_07550 [Rhodospirillales bacterium]|nr:hypothetical protein [Rhodospirillales bacterium]
MARIIATAALLVVLGTRGSLAADLVVIESTAPGLVPGQIVGTGTPITLASGTGIKVVAEDGRVQSLTGPYSGALTASPGGGGDANVVIAIARLFNTPTAETSALGTFRGAASPGGGFRGPAPDNGASSEASAGSWLIDVRSPAPQCVPTATAPQLWRMDAVRDATLVVERAPDGNGALVRFPAGETTAAWPDGVAVETSDYLVRETADAWANTVKLRVIPAGAARDIEQVVWMSDNGCASQAKALLTALR